VIERPLYEITRLHGRVGYAFQGILSGEADVDINDEAERDQKQFGKKKEKL
jgi:hypothetical protein